ncbi:type II toxin-antitoxin system PemK/MazF family toxin [Desulfurobacterium thermolithotrophum]|uniref:type II toxin-antitoxin system PemK/MazF family toxin n=1 Tax=Desulfurobacterium thermolithotrophum TaxID=64160 RepID=UPI0013D18277|nr:type II toxin-antitoxin system PemK/MazF family toxin [Desulfurobacterium thermolithotrophum]
MGFRRGDIHLVKFDPVKGVEPGKIRPAIIFQSQELLDIDYPTVIVIPLTTTLKGDYPLRLRISRREKLERESEAMVDQIRAVDISKIYSEKIASLTDKELKDLEEALEFVVGIKGL